MKEGSISRMADPGTVGGQQAKGIHPERDSEGMFPKAKAGSHVSEWKFLFVCIFYTACTEER